MVNGVMSIVAAVLFGVVALSEGVNPIWLTIAGIYLVWGILNLIVYAVKNIRKQKAAQAALKKAEEKANQKREEPKQEHVPAENTAVKEVLINE